MKEYIDRAALKQELAPYEENDFSQQMDVILTIVDSLPAADVAPVRHGRWESNGPDDIVVYCSQCMMPQDAPSNYCPSCGALMDKEDEHEVS